MTEEKRKRLSRHAREVEGERPPMRLTERDRDVIKAVNDHRALFTHQLQQLFFGSRSTAQFRLALLFQHEYLNRQYPTLFGDAAGSTEALYTLGKRGAQLLVDTCGYDEGDLRLPKRRGFSWKFIEHLLKINDVRVSVAVACQTHGFTLDTWWDETVFRAHPDYVALKDRRGRTRKKPVFPDGYFVLSTPRGTSRFFLEVDRGTEALAKFAPQIAVYEAYVASGQYQARFNARSLRILIVTSSPKRLAHLKRVVEKVGGDRKYWFTTFAALSPDTCLTAPVWERLGSRETIPLIDVNT